jgi:serine protease Do
MIRLPTVPARTARCVALAAVCLLAACSTPPAADPRGGFASALARAMPFAVGVYGVARSEPAGIGSVAPSEAGRGASAVPYARIGAGFLIDAAGHIVTAAHVVADSDEVIVKLADQRVLRARLIGTDPDTDIALLHIDSAGPVAPPLGRSTVAAGIVGGMDRHFGDEPELLFVQTDLALNPGNSGGPLLDATGDIVGMNLRTVVGAYGAPGVSLSIPIEFVLAIVAELRASGSIVRPRRGAEFDDVTAPVAIARGRSTVQGAMVAIVRRGSLAERLGLKVDDIVLALNDRPIAHSADLARALLAWRQEAGTRIVVMRGEALLTLRLD